MLVFLPSDFSTGQGSSCASKPDQVPRKAGRTFLWAFPAFGFVLKGYGLVSSSSEASSVLAFSSQGGHRRPAAASLAAIPSRLCLLVSLAVSSSPELSRYLSGTGAVWLGTRWRLHQMKAMPPALHDTLNKFSLLSGRKVFAVMTESVPHFVSQAFLTCCFVCNCIWWIRVSSEFPGGTCNPRYSVLTHCYLMWQQLRWWHTLEGSPHLQHLPEKREFKKVILCSKAQSLKRLTSVNQTKSSVQPFSGCGNDRCVFCL